MGFYINATPNKENHESAGQWTPNNRYVLHNKIYYRTGDSGASARQQTRSVDFVPVIFGNEEQDDDENGGAVADDICVYDLQGRMVATEQQVKEGMWRNQVPAGVYILRSARGTQGGRKVIKK